MLEEVRVESPRRYSVVTRVYPASSGVPDANVAKAASTAPPAASLPRAVEIEISGLQAPTNREIVLRLQTSLGSAAASFWVHDGLAWRRRGPPPGEDEPYTLYIVPCTLYPVPCTLIVDPDPNA
mgnify:CR=1 FL=1